MTSEEAHRVASDQKRLEKEHEAIRVAVVRFNNSFNELETALSALLYSILNIPEADCLRDLLQFNWFRCSGRSCQQCAHPDCDRKRRRLAL